MPKRVDHDERRRQIAAAVWRIAADHGLDAVNMRDVATEAGVSLRLVQYYFETKHNLLVLALRYLNERSEQLATARIAATLATTPEAGSTRIVLREALMEFLPIDDQHRDTLRVHLAYYVRSLNDPELAAVFLADETPVEDLVAGLLDQAHEQGELLRRIDAKREADLLVSGVNGVGMDLLHGRRQLDDVVATIEYHLARLFGDPPTTSAR
ncbi:MAG TPA: TetR/AcrR family transcriptional regulator [Pseudonocardiaceae bacterium]|jgi:AcrR family transcriptional regulator|nr:TetR/AcrR family transcriptional regulator [Pseudonocardiaceae bacterium]